MIQKCSREQYSRLTSLFKGWHNTMVLSCLEGEMGDVYSTEEMMSAKLDIGDFCFFGGKANENLLYHKRVSMKSAENFGCRRLWNGRAD